MRTTLINILVKQASLRAAVIRTYAAQVKAAR
jgi:hypothetical protein